MSTVLLFINGASWVVPLGRYLDMGMGMLSGMLIRLLASAWPSLFVIVLRKLLIHENRFALFRTKNVPEVVACVFVSLDLGVVLEIFKQGFLNLAAHKFYRVHIVRVAAKPVMVAEREGRAVESDAIQPLHVLDRSGAVTLRKILRVLGGPVGQRGVLARRKRHCHGDKNDGGKQA